MRLLITGATGFVGSSVVRAALGRGHEVVAVVRSRARAAALGDDPGLRLVDADLTDGAAMRRAAGAPADVALHLAWTIGPVFRHEGTALHWLDFAAVLGLGGLWLFVFFRTLAGRALVPARDPYFKEALAHGGH